MHRSQVPPSPASSKVAQPRLGAWAIRKPSTNRLSPYNQKEISQLLKASKTLERTSKLGMTKSKNEVDDVQNPGEFPLRRKSSKILSTIKARLEKDSRIFNARLRELEPTIKSLSMAQAQATPRLKNSRTLSHRLKTSKASAAVESAKKLEKGRPGTALLPPPNLEGEKLITIGGYIISLQETSENITSVIRPRLSSDKSGLELEIKIAGCNPVDIKFEKRYDSLIVIGVNQNQSTVRKEDAKSLAVVKNEKDVMYMSMRDFDQDSHSGFAYPSDHESIEDIHEIINIFVPKHVALNQIFISKPDTKGRIFVKGP